MREHFIANDQLPKQPLTDQAYTVMGVDPEIKGGGGEGGGRSQKNFSALWGLGAGPSPGTLGPQFGLKIRGVAPPLDPPLYYRTVLSALVFLFWLSLVSVLKSFP